MESKSLQTASSYINNLLLSRGLLRNGLPIDFAEPARTTDGADATMAKIMNLVHDLILRRDVGPIRIFPAQDHQSVLTLSSVKPTLFLHFHKIYKSCGHRRSSKQRPLRASRITMQSSIDSLRFPAHRKRPHAQHCDLQRQEQGPLEKRWYD